MNFPLLRDSFETLKPYAKEVMEHFFEVLRQKYPDAALAIPNPNRPDSLLLAMSFVVGSLDQPGALREYLAQAGGEGGETCSRLRAHFAALAGSLLFTLQYFFEESWTPELRKAWCDALGVIRDSLEAGPAAELGPPAGLGDEMRKNVRETALKILTGALNDPAILEAVRKVAAIHAQELLARALNAELEKIKREVQPGVAA